MDADAIARACAEAMWQEDEASRGLGLRLVAVGSGRAEIALTVAEAMTNGHGMCHGGFIFALADSAFAFACNTYNEATVAIGCSIDYVAPARLGDTLTAQAMEESRSGRTGNYDVRIENQNGQLIALFHGKSYKVRGPVLAQETPDE